MISGFLGFLYSIFIRLEGSYLGVGILFGDYSLYNCLITSHGLIMLFGFIMPITMGGLANYFIPTMLCLPDTIFARINAVSYFVFVNGVIVLYFGIQIEDGIGTGWTIYPPLSSSVYHSSNGVDYLILAIHILGVSSILNSINLLCTILLSRLRYLSYVKYNLFIWSIIFSISMLLIILPVLAGCVTLLLLDRNFNTCFLKDNNVLLFIHLFWYFGHPEVYVIIFPFLGIISYCIKVMHTIIFSEIGMLFSLSSITFIGFFVWAHHMFIDLESNPKIFFGSLTCIIGVPTAIKLFNWIFSIFFNLIFFIEGSYILFFIFSFLIGGITGIWFANSGLDILIHDTMSIVSHFHFILSIASVIGFVISILVFIVKVCFKIEACNLYYKVLLFLLLNGSKALQEEGHAGVNPR